MHLIAEFKHPVAVQNMTAGIGGMSNRLLIISIGLLSAGLCPSVRRLRCWQEKSEYTVAPEFKCNLLILAIMVVLLVLDSNSETALFSGKTGKKKPKPNLRQSELFW